MSKTEETPLLNSFLDLMCTNGALNYCAVCLRTQQERRLVKNRALKEFTRAMKIEKIWQHHYICYTCERQANNALRFLKAATFAAALDTIFVELMYQKIYKKSKNVLRDANFQKILKQLDLKPDGIKNSVADWENELATIRNTTQLTETEPLVVESRTDTSKSQVNGDTSESPAYIIPDDPPPDRYGEITGVTVCSKGVIVNPVTGRNNRDADNYITQPGNTENSRDANDSIVLGSQQPKISETVIIYEDENEENDVFHLKIAKVESECDTPSTSQPIVEETPTPTPQAPYRLVVPLESLLEKPKEIFTGDSVLVGSSDGTYSMHPIAIKEGVTTIPSLNAKIINGKLIYEATVLPLPNIENNLLKNLLQQPPCIMPFAPNNNVITQPNIPNWNVPTNVLNQSNVAIAPKPVNSVLPAPEPNRSKRELVKVQNEDAQSKKRKELPATITASENKDRIDWEDKIPMDVITFVGANDPSLAASKIAGTYIAQGKANGPQNDSNVIDLC